MPAAVQIHIGPIIIRNRHLLYAANNPRHPVPSRDARANATNRRLIVVSGAARSDVFSVKLGGIQADVAGF